MFAHYVHKGFQYLWNTQLVFNYISIPAEFHFLHNIYTVRYAYENSFYHLECRSNIDWQQLFYCCALNIGAARQVSPAHAAAEQIV